MLTHVETLFTENYAGKLAQRVGLRRKDTLGTLVNSCELYLLWVV